MARLLVCDDDPGIRDLLVVTLELDHEVRAAVNGRDLIDQLEADAQVDVVVCDVMMPEMDGFEALQQVRSRPETADVGFIMLSARVSDHDQDTAFAAGADAYVTKPFDPDHLERTIAELLERTPEERRARRATSTGA